jgi:hypothetical protein
MLKIFSNARECVDHHFFISVSQFLWVILNKRVSYTSRSTWIQLLAILQKLQCSQLWFSYSSFSCISDFTAEIRIMKKQLREISNKTNRTFKLMISNKKVLRSTELWLVKSKCKKI